VSTRSGAQFHQQSRQHGGCGIGADSEGQVTEQAFAVEADITLEAAAFKHQSACALDDERTGIGTGHVHCVAVEELQPKLFLGSLHTAAEGRLTQVTSCGSTAEVARVSQCHKVLQSSQVHDFLRVFHQIMQSVH
jgi:hypothetical protein